MKLSISILIALSLLNLGGTLRGDIVYSNVNTGIATTFTGTTVAVGDGSLNLFFGGAGLANDANLQPFRTASTGISTVLNIPTDTFISGSSGSLASGAGGSIDHLGAQFSTGTDGYVGFKLDDTDYGWMRVQLTYGVSGGVVKDWAYDDSGATIKTGWIKTDTVSGSAQTVTLNPGTGETFTLSSTSPLVNASGYTNSVLKTGDGTTVLTGTNTYTGTTNVSAGTLMINGNISTSTLTTVENGGTLGGSGTVGALTVENGGTLAPGSSPSTLTVAGALGLNTSSVLGFTFNPLDVTVGSSINDLVSVSGNLTLSGLLNVTATSGSFSSLTSGTWRMFDYTGTLTNDTLAFNTMPTLASGYSWLVDTSTPSQVNLSIVAVPEPSAALLGGLGVLALLRRRRIS